MQSAHRRPQLVVSVFPALALVLLTAAGLVLTTSWFIEYSASVLATALVVAIIAAITGLVSGWREARRTGIGYLRSLVASTKRLGRFVINFF